MFHKIIECSFPHRDPWPPHGYGIGFACQTHLEETENAINNELKSDGKKWYHPMEDKLYHRGLKHILNRKQYLENGMTNITFFSNFNHLKSNQYFVIFLIT